MLTKLTVRNFKGLDRWGRVEIELGNPVVFIGPKNSGKTSSENRPGRGGIAIAPDVSPGILPRPPSLLVPVGTTQSHRNASHFHLFWVARRTVQPCAEMSSDDIDVRAASELFAGVSRPLTPPKQRSLGLVVGQGARELPSIGAVLLFGKTRGRRFSLRRKLGGNRLPILFRVCDPER